MHMFLPIRIFGLTFGALICVTAAAGDFTMAAVGSFGERLTDCRVDSFRFLNAAPGTRGEYKDSFHLDYARTGVARLTTERPLAVAFL